MKTPDSSTHSRILILDFGSQYTQVIARRIRECQVYSEIVRFDTPVSEIAAAKPNGLILSGGPASVYDKGAPQIDPEIFSLGIPVLGICYGLMLMAHHLGGQVVFTGRREYGPGTLHIKNGSELFNGLGSHLDVWNSHGDEVTALPKCFRAVGTTEGCDFAAVEDPQRKLYGLQFHPEVAHTPRGKEILQNFVYHICHCAMDWTMGSFIEEACARVRKQVGDQKVVLGLSGGVDSSVTAALLHKAIGDQLTCIFVNNGLLRAREEEIVQRVFGENFHVRLKYVDASERFLALLKGVTDPETKRKLIGNEFINVFQQATEDLLEEDRRNAARRHGGYKFLAQGTLYPDVIESVSIGGNPAQVIKSHHNVGGLPEKMHFELVEPVRQLFKDEVRQAGLQLGLPKEIVYRQPFPGPGLAVRILGEVTLERLSILREADTIVQSEMEAADWYYKVWQSFAVLLPVQSVGVMGDQRTYENTAALRIVESQDGMTADWVRIPYELLARISNRISNEVKGVNRVVFDISSKPPSTIEWE
ncbi:MAG: GMP synthase (glutamine-hydrolyzing) [Verrucomicrobia bacterium]|nr:MAG: GMP synthase (glutamine-hydrolyzing) [Verrucomicrobiota bacterium]PYK27096.1 MAG: GMP synthase (glutamine-hydrolyzing) [Verrucomicrobiota bacterium]PYK49356.1 MAG: GMP synthase (glutamine-hydrolyzing) [Verrucomicrobiota bacterium]